MKRKTRRRTISGSVYTWTGVYPERSRRDAENRLTDMSGSITASYVYDGDGKRVNETAGDNCMGYTSVGNGPYDEDYRYTPNGNLESKSSVGSYVYGASSPGNCQAGTQTTKPHAVQQAGSNVYSYDCNGNMTGRTVGGVTYSLVHDAENRLQQVKQGSTVLASYTYDADGHRVKAVMGSSTTVYIGAYYEKTTSGSSTTITKYYQAGGQRVAMRVNGVVRWLATDHLGSTSITASETGARMSELRYKPWGESRGIPFGTTPTQRRFTGQVLDEVAGGLYFYNARYYDPALGRFAQADTIVPNPGNPQNLNRYSYALGNPLRFSDPTGYYEEPEIEQYLRDLYPEFWQRYWDAWRADKVFWAMLRAAKNGDRLYAPTTSLGVGSFGAKDGSFNFTSENGAELWLYQGRGPYALEMPNRQFREGFSVQAVASEHLVVGTDENIGLTWEQPLYNYTAQGPEFTGYMRLVSYAYTDVSINWGASSSIPSLTGVAYAAIRWGTKGAVKALLSGPVGTALFVADIGVAINEGVSIHYQLQVDYKDTRTYLSPPSPCLTSPCFKAAP